MKKKSLQLVLNEFKESDDPTVLPCTFIIMDFERSANNVIVEEDVALEGAKTLINKPIVAKYIEVEDYNTPTDNFTSHEMKIKKNRYGEDTVVTDTVPIGVFTSEGYISTVNNKRVLMADATLWQSRYSDACDLLKELAARGIKINTSCEYLYNNYSFKNGVEYHHSPIYFEGHALLASENRGDQDVVLPAYDSATLLSFNEINKFNRLVAQANQETEQKEDENMPEQEIEKVEEQVSEEVVETQEEIVVEETPETIEEKQEESQEDEELKSLQNELSQLKDEYAKLEAKFNESTEKLTQLNSLVDELKPIKEQFEAEKLQKAVSEKKDFYSIKFEALNAKEKFESEEVQELILKSVNEADEGKQAILQLNTMLVDLVDIVVTKETTPIKELASKRENLLPADDSFDSRYSL